MASSGPKFLGRPSPAMAKMKRMTRGELSEHIQRLQAEADQIAARIDRLKGIPETREDQLRRLRGAHRRLVALHEEGRRLYVVADD